MNETFMKEKPVLPLLLSMALPMMVSMLVNSLYNIVDGYFVAQISEDAMTALSLVFPVQNAINAVAIGFGIGISAVISLSFGGGQEHDAGVAATHGLALSLLHGIVLAVVCIAIMPWFLPMFTTSEQVVALGLEYSRIVFAFSPILAANLFFEKLFQSVGRMKVTMVCLMFGCVTNIILDPILIARMGIAGAAIATVLGQALPVGLYLLFYLRPFPVRLGRKYLVQAWDMDRRLYSIGVPAILNLALPSLLVSALNGILAGFDQSYVVVLGSYYKLQTFLYLPANGIIQGMRPLIGYNYGAGERGRVKEIYLSALGMSGAIMALGTVVCLLLPDRLIGLFTTNAETIQIGVTALRIICAGFLFSAVSVTSCGALEGLGKGGPSLVISLCRYVLVIIPAAFLLSRVLGPTGVWSAFVLAELATAAVAFTVYRRAVGASV